MLEIVRVPVLTDNYVWLAHDHDSGETAVVDPAVAGPVLEAAARRGWRITQIWNTHYHSDHIGGNAAIKAATNCLVTAPAAEAERIATMDRGVSEGDRVQLGKIEAIVMEVPAHTAGHVAYHLPSEATIFVGDTLFAMGCGRLFEGTADQMYSNLRRLASLPLDTKVYCAHEYTRSNGRFALTVEPDNEALIRRMEEVEASLSRGDATVPTSIELEMATNPFMRAASAGEFARIRLAKDDFVG